MLAVVKNWIQGNKWNKILCFYSLGWMFKTTQQIEQNYIEWFIENGLVEVECDELLIQNAINFAMQSLGAKSDNFNRHMTKMADTMLSSEKKSVQSKTRRYMEPPSGHDPSRCCIQDA